MGNIISNIIVFLMMAGVVALIVVVVTKLKSVIFGLLLIAGIVNLFILASAMLWNILDPNSRHDHF